VSNRGSRRTSNATGAATSSPGTPGAKTENDNGGGVLAVQDARPIETAEDVFAAQCAAHHLPPVVRQLLFAKETTGRMWRFDFAFRDYWLAVEIEGLAVQRMHDKSGPVLVVRGRHASIVGIREDMLKYNTAALLGWTVLRFEQVAVRPRHALEMTMRVLAARGWKCEP